MKRTIHRVLAVVLMVTALVLANGQGREASTFAQVNNPPTPRAPGSGESLPPSLPGFPAPIEAATEVDETPAPSDAPAITPEATTPPSSTPAAPALSPTTTNTASAPLATLTNPNLPANFPKPPTPVNVAMIRIDGEIQRFTYLNLVQRMKEAVDGGANVIVIEIDTYGGLLDAALDISKHIKGTSIATVAWVNPNAYSAGSLIAAACDLIVMKDAAMIGDTAPIDSRGIPLPPHERAKAISPLLAEFKDSAARHGVDYTLYHAMVELDVQVYRVRLPSTGEERLVNQYDRAIMVDGADPKTFNSNPATATGTLTPSGPAGSNTAAGVTPGVSPEEVVPASELGRWVEVARIHDGKTLLTISNIEALDVGLSKATISTEADLQAFLGAPSMYKIHTSWTAITANFLSKPLVRGLLIAIMLIAAYIEMQAPGLGVAGAIAVLALVALIGAPYLVGLSRVWHLVIFGVGAVMLIIELITPTFGILGIGGIFLMLAGLTLMVVPSNSYGIPQYDMLDRLAYSMAFTMMGVILAGIGLFFVTKYFGNIPILSRMILGDPEPVPQGPGLLNAKAGTINRTSGDDALGEGELKVGDVGKATTTLHPGGQASIGGYNVDVICISGMVDPGQRVKITAIEGNRIQVDRA